MFFRGAGIVRSHFKWLLEKHSLADANQVIITGLSAGGIGTYLWADYVKTLIKSPESVLAIPDSGIFVLYENYQTHTNFLQNMVVNMWKLANIEELTPIQ